MRCPNKRVVHIMFMTHNTRASTHIIYHLTCLAAPRLPRTGLPRNARPLEAVLLTLLASRHSRTGLLRNARPFEAAFQRSLLQATF